MTFNSYVFFTYYYINDCAVSVSHNFVGHVHEAHGRKATTSSEHGEKREEEEDRAKRKAEKRGTAFYL